MQIKVLADEGQNFYKICLSIFPEDYCSHHETKRSTYREGGRIAKTSSKLTGVKKLIILYIVPDIKETYENFKLFFKLTNLNNISFRFVSDFKIMLLVNGLQTTSSSYPCPYCFISLKDLRSTNAIQENVKIRTYGDIKENFNAFSSIYEKNIKNAKHCFSTVNKPLVDEKYDMPVIQKCFLPELHLLQGFVNHLFWKGLVPLLGKTSS